MKQNPRNKIPQRTCAGCWQESEKEDLERFVFLEGEGLLHDLRQRAPGRGIWVHPSGVCLEKATVRGGFRRALKQAVETPGPEELRAMVAEGVARRRWDRLTDAARARQIVTGQTMVSEALKKNSVALMIVASEVGESTEKKFCSNADRKGLRVIRSFTGEELGTLTGREFVSVLAITEAKMAEEIAKEDRRWHELLPAES